MSGSCGKKKNMQLIAGFEPVIFQSVYRLDQSLRSEGIRFKDRPCYQPSTVLVFLHTNTFGRPHAHGSNSLLTHHVLSLLDIATEWLARLLAVSRPSCCFEDIILNFGSDTV